MVKTITSAAELSYRDVVIRDLLRVVVVGMKKKTILSDRARTKRYTLGYMLEAEISKNKLASPFVDSGLGQLQGNMSENRCLRALSGEETC